MRPPPVPADPDTIDALRAIEVILDALAHAPAATLLQLQRYAEAHADDADVLRAKTRLLGAQPTLAVTRPLVETATTIWRARCLVAPEIPAAREGERPPRGLALVHHAIEALLSPDLAPADRDVILQPARRLVGAVQRERRRGLRGEA